MLFRGEEGKAKGMNQEDTQTLANYFHNALYLALKDYLEHRGPTRTEHHGLFRHVERRGVEVGRA